MPYNKDIIIAIDGYSSCGKSSFAKKIAQELGYAYIDTGAMYRAVTLYFLQHKAFVGDAVDESKLSLLQDIVIDVRFNTELNKSETYLNNVNVEEAIRTIEVSNHVSQIAAIKAVRLKMVALQQAMGVKKRIVMDGRDIGTVVFPNAEIKIFMTASVDVRADRRYREMIAKGDKISLDEVKANIEKRDFIDTTRAESPLTQSKDALVLDNSYLSFEQQMEWLKKLL